MGGVSGVAPARVAVIGAGMAGTNAARIAAGMGAEVVVLDINVARLHHIDDMGWGRTFTVRSSVHTVEEYVLTSDLVIGAVLVAGARAPVVVTEELVRQMKPGAVIVDISIDQGGCIETARETTHSDPIYELGGVIHYAVGNIPGAVPHTATYALSNATMPYVVALAGGFERAVHEHPELRRGINIADGMVTNRAVAASLGLEYTDPTQALGV